jgi:hypothetical protein
MTYQACVDLLAIEHPTPEQKALRTLIKDTVRQPAKAGSFGYPGGLGPEKMVEYARKNYGARLTFEESSALRQAWRRKYPEIPEYLRWIGDLVGDGTANVQQFKSGRCRGRVSYTEAANGFFQGLCADAAKHAMWCVTWRQFMEPSSSLYGTHVFAFVHDEVIIEVPKDRAETCRLEFEQVMKDAYQEWTPRIPVRVESHIMERWTKM